MNYIKKYINNIGYIFIIIFLIYITITLIVYPDKMIKASIDGVDTWFYTVLPSLLPFFIISELLMKLGVLDFISLMLEPFMRPLFNVPGEGSFTFAMSITSGYPVGAKLVSQLTNQKKISIYEGQRLLSFCSTSGPLFMIGAVSVGMLNSQALAPLIAIPHYLSAIAMGLLFKYYKVDKKTPYKNKNYKYNIKKIRKYRQIKKISIGKVLNNSVNDSFKTILLIGGFIILYSVIIEALNISKIIDLISYVLMKIIPFSQNKDVYKGLIAGFIEVTNGCKLIAESNAQNIGFKLCLINFLIGWSGLSIHSQVATFMFESKIKMSIYILSKFLQGVFASLFTIIILKLNLFNLSISVAKNLVFEKNMSFINLFVKNTKIFIFIIIITLILSVINLLIFKAISIFKKEY
ncbi:sporulation integral membrane protein YlbJ [Clostridiisalibacter paucivorans]|uniref:sporulation integral membrane protein YlbJ n=1 Tax=Clostridiisalibacter paucivorans TaxID=408753 RepID=UPI0006888472|nr:sporulation integral membrane protein YlbJ [Clostridiisalibacter paucivorans]